MGGGGRRNQRFADSLLEGDGFELVVPRHESPLRWRSDRPPRIETSREPGDFSIEASPHAPHRSGHGPAGGNLLWSNPCASWRKRWATCGATVRFYRLGDDYLRPSKAEAERRIDGDGADPDQGGDRREAIQDAALCSAILGSILSRRWARPSDCCSPRHRYGRACGTIERAAEREASLSGFARDAGEHECSMSPRSSEETINSYSYV